MFVIDQQDFGQLCFGSIDFLFNGFILQRIITTVEKHLDSVR